VRLATDAQIKRVLKVLRDEGLPIGRVDILDNGISVSTISTPAAPQPAGGAAGSAYDAWKEQDNDGPAPRQDAA